MKLIALIFLCLPPTAIAQSWVKVNETPEAEFYIEMSSLKRNGPTVTYWAMQNKKPISQLISPSKELSTKFRVIQNCSSEEYRITFYADYEKPMGEGKVINSNSLDVKPTPNIPGTSGYEDMKIVCKKTAGK